MPATRQRYRGGGMGKAIITDRALRGGGQDEEKPYKRGRKPTPVLWTRYFNLTRSGFFRVLRSRNADRHRSGAAMIAVTTLLMFGIAG